MRCFYALPLPEEAKTHIEARVLESAKVNPRLKWVARNALHVTVIFLGELTEREAAGCIGAMEGLPSVIGAFKLTFDGVITFPPRGRPRVCALHAGAGSENCLTVHDYLRDRIPSSIKREGRPFKAHATLARVREGDAGPDLAAFTGFKVTAAIGRCVLYSSLLTPAGPVYSELASVDFPEV